MRGVNKNSERWNNFETREVWQSKLTLLEFLGWATPQNLPEGFEAKWLHMLSLPLFPQKWKVALQNSSHALSLKTNSTARVCITRIWATADMRWLWWLCCCDTQGSWQTLTTLILNTSPYLVSLCLLYLAKPLWKASNIQPTTEPWYLWNLLGFWWFLFRIRDFVVSTFMKTGAEWCGSSSLGDHKQAKYATAPGILGLLPFWGCCKMGDT